MILRTFFFVFLALLGLVFAADTEEGLAAGIDDNAKAAYFVLPSAGYVFALNVAANGDVYYHMNAPAQSSWMGVGFGKDMSNTRMLIAYIGENGHNLTNTARIATGHSEPEWESDIVIDNIHTDAYAPFSNTLSPDGIMIAHAVCRNCSSWIGGSIDVNNEQQPFIYALGPNITLRSDDKNAPLRVHASYGTFNLDMTVATSNTSYGRVPAPQDPGLQVGDSFWAFANYFSSAAYNLGTLADWAPAAHAVFMCIAFLLIFPLGAISLRLIRRAFVHATAQMIGIVFVVIGLGLGIYASSLYNKSKHYNTYHQIVGLLVFAALFLQMGLGLAHHLVFMRSGVPTIIGKIHRFLGISIMLLAVVNCGLGFQFSGRSSTAYAAVVAVMVVILGGLTLLVWRYNRQHMYKPEKEPYSVPNYSDRPGEYEMRSAPFAPIDNVYTPRTPHFAAPKLDDPENYRQHLMRSNTSNTLGQDSMYTDTPASDRENPFKAKWEAMPLP
ncbi:hypothetical protein DOTSEDRAFT_69050 [Dothistroma septosporum NZE10]|uniref:Cytochrome b561 domain-containing protein n=1 Tax=Dothistroma septosporum (strain NZE10 / CBS 128990) TaxID=675120 RepID=N1Q5I3_DOTSN|nr:hypothetical protein DOTSEDRAFT_69050 [Dothistroma septosporum NZE10]